MYCAPFWYDSTKTAMVNLKVAYNHSLRRLLGLPSHNSASGMFVNMNILSFGELLRKNVYNFRNRLETSDNKISLLDRDPFLTDKIPSEKIIFWDVPLDVPDDEVIQFLREHSNVTLRSSIVCDRIRNNNNHLTDCFNGNRHVYVQSGFTPVLPEIATIGNHKCRIYHESQALSCKRCHEDGHRAIDINVCPAYIPEDNTIQIFWRSWDPLSNFYECKLEIYDHVFYSSEHAYQYQKMAHIGNEKLANEVLQAQTPRDAKNIANCVPSDKLQDWHNIKLDVMKEILVAKVKSCDKYRNALLGSGSNCLIEGTMDLYWGCRQTAYLASITHPYYLPGQNWLGSIHSDIRHQVVHGQLPRNGPSRQPIRSTTPLCKPTDNPLVTSHQTLPLRQLSVPLMPLQLSVSLLTPQLSVSLLPLQLSPPQTLLLLQLSTHPVLLLQLSQM